jgi:hypothetical protein
MVNYGTFSALAERLVNKAGDVRALTKEAILDAAAPIPAGGSASSSASASDKGMATSDDARLVLLIDEVDVFFSDEFYGKTYRPVLPLQLGEVAELQRMAWKLKGRQAKLIFSDIQDTDSYRSLMLSHAGVKKLLDSQLLKMVHDLEKFESRRPEELYTQYKVADGKIAYKAGVCYDSKISYGYMTLWTYFTEMEAGRVTEAALVEHLGLLIECGQFSYAEIPAQRYEIILGVTGTLVPETEGGPHPLGSFERDIIHNDYKIKGCTELPSVYGEKNLTFREHEHVRVVKDEDEFNNTIDMEVTKAHAGRAVLVFFESETKLRAWLSSPYGERASKAGTVQCITSATRARDISLKVKKATHSGVVTLLSREHGRGLDFHCSDKIVEQTGGLHVVQTFFSGELSEEIQIRGRTARQKNKGSFQMVLLAKDLDKFDITLEEITEKEKGKHIPVAAHSAAGGSGGAAGGSGGAAAATQTMYEFLHEKRAVILEKSVGTRKEAVECALQEHNNTITFQKNLVALASGSVAKRDACMKFLSGRNLVGAKCRLVCLSDATGSMTHVWKQTQNGIRAMLERIAEISGGSGNIEVKWVAYRDYELDQSMLLEPSEWTDDPASLVRFVGGIKCRSGHGCDGPEAVEAALHNVNSEPEPPTRVILIGDAPPHSELKGAGLKQCIPSASNRLPGGLVEGGVLQTDWKHECTLLQLKGVKVFPYNIGNIPLALFKLSLYNITYHMSSLLNMYN